MNKQSFLEQKIEQELEKLELNMVEIQWLQNSSAGKTIRVTINDPKSHVGHEQCLKVSKSLRKLLDESDENFGLEVWSPGVGRELNSERDFEIFCGKLIEITLASADDGSLPKNKNKPEKCLGILQGRDEQAIKVLVDDRLEILPLSSVKKVVLALDKPQTDQSDENLVEISVEDI